MFFVKKCAAVLNEIGGDIFGGIGYNGHRGVSDDCGLRIFSVTTVNTIRNIFYFTIIRSVVGSDYYEGRVVIENVAKGKLFKDITKNKNVTKDITSSYGENPKSRFLRNVSMISISNSAENVNPDFICHRDCTGSSRVRACCNCAYAQILGSSSVAPERRLTYSPQALGSGEPRPTESNRYVF